MTAARSRFDRRDALVALLLFAGTVLYLSALPPNLGGADEAIHLYESKRLLDGEVLYRDVFEMITPFYMYLMAGLFALFGADITTARVAQAVIHAITAVLLYASCRRLGVRTSLAWWAPLAYVVVCQAAWPIASQHWLSTMFCVGVLLACIDLPADRARRAVVPGIVLGMLIGVQHQRGALVAAGVFAWLIADSLLQRRLRPEQPSAPIPARLAWLVGGALIVDVPMMIAVFAVAGFQPPWRALVIFPLFDYRGSTHCPWGHVNIMSYAQSTYTFPRLLTWLPAILPLSAARLVWAMQRGDAQQAARLLLLLALALSWMVSIFYFPDFIHIAFIAAIFFAAIAENLEWAVRAIPAAPTRRRAAAWGAAAVILAAAGYRLQSNLVRLRTAFPIMRDTAFGRIALPDEKQAEVYDRVLALLPELPAREIYCYPVISHLYLMADARNPTPYGFLSPGYSGPDLVQHVVDILDEKKLPYLVVWMLRPTDDPISDYIRRDYEPLNDGTSAGKYIYRRKAT